MQPRGNASPQNYTEAEIQEYLSMLQRESTVYFIPALVFQSLLVVVGSVGNTLVLVIYTTKMTKTPLRIFMISMAIFDLPTNMIAIPGDIYDMFHIWDFDKPLLCKLRRFVNSVFVISTFLVLIIIAATRYTMICKPFKKQITVTQAKMYSFATFVLAAVFSIPYAIIHGSQTKPTPNPNIVGHFCQTDDSYVHTVWPTVNSVFFVSIFVLCCSIIAWFYICIGCTTWKHRKRLNYMSQHPSAISSMSKMHVSAITGLSYKLTSKLSENIVITEPRGNSPMHIFVDFKGSDTQEQTTPLNLTPFSAMNCHSQQSEESINCSEILSTTRKPESGRVKQSIKVSRSASQRSKAMKPQTLGRTSWMAIAISLSFILGMIPFLVLNFYKTAAPKSFASLHGVSMAIYQLFFRSCFMNSAINPVVYCLMDRKFKKELLTLFKCR